MVAYHRGRAHHAPRRQFPLHREYRIARRRRPKGASIPYAVSKAGLIHMTKLLAVSLAPAIRVNAVAPGLVDTPMTADWEAAQKLWRERSPMQRAALPEDIADIVAMLVASKYLTGEIILADGGLNLT
jgi:NAD(P)-dependent dehydrogenase (short-subunit alcohol dehydrogenase family)